MNKYDMHFTRTQFNTKMQKRYKKHFVAMHQNNCSIKSTIDQMNNYDVPFTRT